MIKKMKKNDITIIDYGSGNLQSVKKAFDYLRVKTKITSNPKEILNADKIVFPGVGNFGEAMKNLRKRKLLFPIKKELISQKKQYLGICLGLQLLFEESEESPNVKGLSIFQGKVKKFERGKIPQIGWNKVIPKKRGDEIFREGYAYFINSYYVVPENELIIAATTNYFGKFTSAIKYKNITGVQFHPEKSGSFGIEFLQRWLEKC